jgi:hypothetical protein
VAGNAIEEEEEEEEEEEDGVVKTRVWCSRDPGFNS